MIASFRAEALRPADIIRLRTYTGTVETSERNVDGTHVIVTTTDGHTYMWPLAKLVAATRVPGDPRQAQRQRHIQPARPGRPALPG